MSQPTDTTHRARPVTGPGRMVQALAVLALVVHLAALYWPRVDIQGPVTWTDKVVHVLLFGIPALLLVTALRRPWPALVVLALHAPVSELVQHYWLPNRSGDAWDAVADLGGVVLGVTLGVVRSRRRRW